MGSNQIIDRLSAQVGSKEMAISILKKRGHLKSDGKTFTKEGLKRNSMTASQRAKDRAARKSGKPASDFKYNPRTNSATLKK